MKEAGPHCLKRVGGPIKRVNLRRKPIRVHWALTPVARAAALVGFVLWLAIVATSGLLRPRLVQQSQRLSCGAEAVASASNLRRRPIRV